ncbi:hypothetical protein WL29_15975 [Burkholderia ubonensis]|uniref:Uncharacterized protein n=1 Tax=Burkholderia ubonensis TaxID=101571 RepID=A0A119HGC2_9BURK|nr:hypothetical protein WL29_15975 [Burkholderia ubonensis]
MAHRASPNHIVWIIAFILWVLFTSKAMFGESTADISPLSMISSHYCPLEAMFRQSKSQVFSRRSI